MTGSEEFKWTNRPANQPDTEPVLVSACLLGFPCRYSGESLSIRNLDIPRHRCVPVCPEELGGLPTPRDPSFFDDPACGDGVWNGTARVITESGEDRSAAFRNGARLTLDLANRTGAKTAYLKERSPSCGVQEVYLGNQRVSGRGVTTALLERNGIRVIGID